ncbi:MAG: IS1595 family transposase [Actinomycetota bacterium]
MDASKAHNARVNRDRGAMSLVKLIEQFADEDRSRAYLEGLRWPDGVRCPNCGFDRISRIQTATRYRRDTKDGKHKKGEVRGKREQFDCLSCGYQFSVKSGTVFHDSHLPLWKWFLATYLMCESKKGMSANQLKRTLEVSYGTAWYLCHRIRWAMKEATVELLSGIVEADETYVGGKRRGIGHQRALDNKTMVLGAIQRDGRIRLRATKRGTQATTRVLHSFLRDVVAETATAIYTDQHKGYKGIADANTRHETVDHSAEEWVRGDVGTQNVESAWSLLKRSIIGSYHQLSAKHLPAYLDEFSFRFNNRENPYLFRDTLLALIKADALSYEELTATQHE